MEVVVVVVAAPADTIRAGAFDCGVGVGMGVVRRVRWWLLLPIG